MLRVIILLKKLLDKRTENILTIQEQQINKKMIYFEIYTLFAMIVIRILENLCFIRKNPKNLQFFFAFKMIFQKKIKQNKVA